MSTKGGYAFRAPRILAVRAESGPVEEEEALQWVASMSHDDKDEEYRVIIATLHGAWESGRAEVTIGVQIGWLGEDPKLNEDQVLHEVGQSDALESAYDIARAALVSLLVTVSLSAFDVPTHSPSPRVFFHDDVEDEFEET